MISFYPDKLIDNENFFENLKELNIKNIPLRNIFNKPLFSLTTEEHKEVFEKLNQNKIKVIFLDFSTNYLDHSSLDYNKIIEIAKIYETRKIIIPLPIINNFQDEKDRITDTINYLLRESRLNKIELVFHINYLIESAVLAYLIKHIKNINFYFNPGLCYINQKSITSYYRLIKRNIGAVALFDMEDYRKPALLGYGNALIIDNIDKLLKDKYRGPIIYDFNLEEYTQSLEKGHKVPFYKKWFGRKKRKAHLEMDEKLNLTEESQLNIVKVIETQLNFIKRYQKL